MKNYQAFKTFLQSGLITLLFILGGPLVHTAENHPRLYISPADIPQIKAKIQSDIFYRKKFDSYVKLGKDELGTDFSSPNQFEYEKAAKIRKMSFAVLFMDPSDSFRSQIAENCREGLLSINEGFLPSDTNRDPRWNWDGSNAVHAWYPAQVLRDYALAYDYLVGAGELNGVDRDKVRSRLILYTANLFDWVRTNREEKNPNHPAILGNFRMQALPGVGLGALLFPDQTDDQPISDPENLLAGKTRFFDSKKALENIMDDFFVYDKGMYVNWDNDGKGTMDHNFAPDGTVLEGPGYQVESSMVMIPFFLAYNHVTGINYFTGANGLFDDRLLKVYEWFAKTLMPNKIFSLAGDQWWGRGSWGVEFVARYSQKSEVLHWLYENAPTVGRFEFDHTIIFYDKPASPASPPPYRTEFFLQTGQAIFRDKWGPDATYLSLMAEGHPVRGHNQADQGAISTLYAKKAMMVLDPGYGSSYGNEFGKEGDWIGSALGHSGITVDSPDISPNNGKSLEHELVHPRTINRYTTAIDRGRLENPLAKKEMDFVNAIVDLETVNVEWDRSLAFVRHQYFLIQDQLTPQEIGTLHNYNWRIHFGGGTQVGNLKSFGNQHSWTMPNEDGDPVTLDVDFLKGPDTILPRNDGPTNYRGGEKFNHTYLMAKSRDSKKTYLTVLTPRYSREAPYVIQNLIPDKMWKIQVAQGEYDLVVSQPEPTLIEGHGLTTDAQFLIMSLSESEGGLKLVSVLSKGGTSINIRAAQDWAIQTIPTKLFYIEDFPPGLGADPGRPYTPLIPPDPGAQASYSPQDLKVSNGAFYPLRGVPLEITYETNQSESIRIRILNVNGEEITTLLDGLIGPVDGSVTWDGTNPLGQRVASGTYLISFQVGDKTKIKKVIVIK